MTQKSQKEKLKQWLRENKSGLIFLAVASAVVILSSFLFGLMATVSKENMLRSLIEAETTIIGFFGIIATYVLMSIDSKIDKLEDRRFELREGKEDDWTRRIENRIAVTEKHRGLAIRLSLTVGFYLVAALLLSILALGIPDALLSFFPCYMSMGLFFTGILGIFTMLRRLSKKIEE